MIGAGTVGGRLACRAGESLPWPAPSAARRGPDLEPLVRRLVTSERRSLALRNLPAFPNRSPCFPGATHARLEESRPWPLKKILKFQVINWWNRRSPFLTNHEQTTATAPHGFDIHRRAARLRPHNIASAEIHRSHRVPKSASPRGGRHPAKPAVCCPRCCPLGFSTRFSYRTLRPNYLILFGSPGRIRTSDQPVNSRLLYH
jgi:hypothetical protein